MKSMSAAFGLMLGLTALGPAAASAAPQAASWLRLDAVLASADRHYPALLAAREEREIALGELRQARGGFDLQLAASIESEPRGFYETDRANLSLAQPTAVLGATIHGGYRIGRGDFAVWDKDMQTNDDGELRAGISVPLLRDRAIDERRAELRRAELQSQRAEPFVEEQRLAVLREAAFAYWEWLAAGRKLAIARSLLRLAENRQAALREASAEGLIAEIVLVDNERLIAEREAIRLAAERRLQQASIALSLYWRDDEGRPVVADTPLLPGDFPALVEPSEAVEAAVERAVSRRPEVARIGAELESLGLSVREARNQLLPRLDLGLEASQDYGDSSGLVDDKGEFEIEAGLRLALPLQRREASGKLQARLAEQTRLEQRARLIRDRIAIEVRDAHSALAQSWLRYRQAERSLLLARELEEAEQIQLEEGNSDLLRLNIREQQAASAAAALVDAKTEYFEAWSEYRAALGDPTAMAPPQAATTPTGG